MSEHISDGTQIRLPSDVIVKAQNRARDLDLTLSDYVKLLVDRDVRAAEHDPWQEPIPKEVDEQWERDIAEFDARQKANPRPGAKTAEQLINLLDEEAARLPDDVGTHQQVYRSKLRD